MVKGVVGLLKRREARHYSDEPGLGCSYGNAGAVSFGSVAPLAMPGVMRDALGMLLDPAAPLRIPLHYLPQAAPWLWREDWASRRITDGSRSDMWSAWAFTALWNLVSVPGAIRVLWAMLRSAFWRR